MNGTFKQIKADAGQPQHSVQAWQGIGDTGNVRHYTSLSFRSLHLGKLYAWN